MKEVKIIDAIMGSGKTHDAIDSMKKHKGNFVYVTPFLDEVERIKSSVPNVFDPKVSHDYDPVEEEYTTVYKRDNLLRMANNKLNMATTHSLFQRLNRNDYTHFINYDLILDEVMTPIKVLDMKSDDIEIAFNEGLIVENTATGEITYTGDDYNGKYYAQLKRFCDTANVIYVNGRLLVWAFPPEIFKNFKSVTVLTYLFEGSLLASYFNYYNIGYKLKKSSDKDEQDKKDKIRPLLNIYHGTANKVGDKQNAFSVTWLEKRSNKELDSISKSVENIVKRNYKSSSKVTGYTTFKKFKSKLSGSGYTKGFISVNERATNKYSDKTTMIYLANRFLQPEIIDYFRSGNVTVDQEQWALAELIQWIWRGSIRKEKPMNLFIPSMRMRDLLEDWLNGNTSNSNLSKAA